MNSPTARGRKIMRALLVFAGIASAILLGGECAAAPLPPDIPTLDQQKTCAEQAEVKFRENIIKKKNVTLDFTSHFSPRLGHCFVTIIMDDKSAASPGLSMWIDDAFEGTMYGQYVQARDSAKG